MASAGKAPADKAGKAAHAAPAGERPRLAWFADPLNGDRGRLMRESEIRVPISTHALHYGSSVFEGIKFYDCGARVAILRLREHAERLVFSASTIGFKLAEVYGRDEIEAACMQVVAANAREGMREGYIRPLVYGSGGIGLGAGIGKFAVAILVAAWVKTDQTPGGMWACFSSFIRPHPRSAQLKAKVGGYYVNNLMALLEGESRGGAEPVLEDHRGFLAEAPSSNLFLVKAGRLVTPDSDSILPGITRQCVIEMAGSLGIPVEVRPVKKEELLAADEAFLCGTASEILPIGTVESTKLGSGKMGSVTALLWRTFRDAAHGRDARFGHWLTTVPLD